MMVVDMLTAAGLDDLIEVRENYITGRFGSRVDFMPSSTRSGMASGYDLIVADELGIHPNADELLAQLRGSLAARDGPNGRHVRTRFLRRRTDDSGRF